MSNLKTASVLAFERKLNPSDALFFSGKWEGKDSHNWKPVLIQNKDIRGTISNRMKKEMDPLKLDAEVQKANLQSVDAAALPNDADTLKVSFTLKILPGVGLPSACNDQAYQKSLTEKIESYVRAHQCEELASRYAENIANGRVLWRNRLGADKVEVRVTDQDGKFYNFDAKEFTLTNFSNSDNPHLKNMAEVIKKGLINESYSLLKIEIFARVGEGQEVFPSQELAQDADKSKVLYSVSGVAAMHSQKVGNAIRTIDTWHPFADEVGPIAVEPYGSVTSRGAAYRQPKEKMDFYNLFDRWIIKDEEPAIEQQHYIVACLIRGGVFGDAK